ncbi:hypothetical protein BH11VER1_BH11VER1_32710 [soil metagenome]
MMMESSSWIDYAQIMEPVLVGWKRREILQGLGLAACSFSVLPGCATRPQTSDEGVAKADEKTEDVSQLLTMTFEESKKLSAQSLVIAPYYKVSADVITVLKKDTKGLPVRVYAKGKVYLQVDFREQLIALGQEAYIERDGELILRGKPLLKRGRSLVEGLNEYSVFYIRGLHLQAIGSHRLTSQPGKPGNDQSYPDEEPTAWRVAPTWTRSWKDGPNPLLPALSPEDIPKEMRASPLLPPVSDDDVPKMLPPAADKPQ